jgi:hypothetical protein
MESLLCALKSIKNRILVARKKRDKQAECYSVNTILSGEKSSVEALKLSVDQCFQAKQKN